MLEMYLCIHLIAMSAVVLDTIFAVGNFEHLSIATRIYASPLNSSQSGPAKCYWFSPLRSTFGFIWNDCFFTNFAFFHLVRCSVGNSVRFGYGETRHVGIDSTWLRIPDGSNKGCSVLSVWVAGGWYFSRLSVGSPLSRVIYSVCFASIVRRRFWWLLSFISWRSFSEDAGSCPSLQQRRLPVLFEVSGGTVACLPLPLLWLWLSPLFRPGLPLSCCG